MSGLKIILTTFSTEPEAASVVNQLLEDRLIACGTMIPGAKSLYHWKGAIEESSEVVVLLKTESGITPRCMERLAELHPYDLPEIILIDPEKVSTPYAAWVKETLSKLD